jgi:hypothetical protein
VNIKENGTFYALERIAFGMFERAIFRFDRRVLRFDRMHFSTLSGVNGAGI